MTMRYVKSVMSFMLLASLFFCVAPDASAQVGLRGLISSTTYQVRTTGQGQQFFIDAAGQTMYLGGAGVNTPTVQINSGPTGIRWFIDRTGARVNVTGAVPYPTQTTAPPPASAPAAASSGNTYSPTFSVAVPPVAPMYAAPYAPYYANPSGQPIYANPTVNNVYRSAEGTVNATGTVNTTTAPATLPDTTSGAPQNFGNTASQEARANKGGRFSQNNPHSSGSPFAERKGTGGLREGRANLRGDRDGMPGQSGLRSNGLGNLGGARSGMQSSRRQGGHSLGTFGGGRHAGRGGGRRH